MDRLKLIFLAVPVVLISLLKPVLPGGPNWFVATVFVIAFLIPNLGFAVGLWADAWKKRLRVFLVSAVIGPVVGVSMMYLKFGGNPEIIMNGQSGISPPVGITLLIVVSAACFFGLSCLYKVLEDFILRKLLQRT